MDFENAGMAAVTDSRRRFAVFTGTRAEYGLLRRVLLGLAECSGCELQLLVGGAHLSRAHGYTIKEVHQDGLKPTAYIDCALSNDDTPGSVCNAMGKTLSETGRTLHSLKPDILVVLGDRYEAFCAAAAAQPTKIPVAHLYGGETTEGAMDEAFRHSITKMSHLHFTSCESYRKRVIQLGEAPERVFNVGSLGVENAVAMHIPDEQSIRNHMGISGDRPYLLCTFHPVTLGDETAAAQCATLLRALEAFPEHAVVFTGANADPEGSIINGILTERAASLQERYRFFMSLGVRNYLAAAKYASAVIGNSSSGVIEAPSLGTPVVDIGDRQKGRIRSESVLHCAHKEQDIAHAIRQALSPESKERARSATNPYQKNGTAAAIVECLLKWPLENILQKSFYDIPINGV